jgi:predicted DNA-binding transcriptional regulator AlpA
MTDRVLIPLAGIGTLRLTRAAYEEALIPIPAPEIPISNRKLELLLERLNSTPASAKDSMEGPRGLRYIRLPEVCARVGLKRSTVYRLISLGRFPKHIKLSEHASAWIDSEIDDFMIARIAERDHESVAVEPPPESPYMRMGEVMKRTGLNSSKIYDLVRKGEFPKWANLPKIASGWLKTDVEAWLVSKPTLESGDING